MEPSTEQQEVAPPTPEVALAPTQDVGTFWERLDQVLALNVESARMRENVETLLGEFPDQVNINQAYKSAIFQPERLALSSSDDANMELAGEPIVLPPLNNNFHRSAETFSSFRIRLNRPLLKVKSVQLVSASIPNATIQIPDNQLIFFYYKIQTIAASSSFYNPTLVYAIGSVVESAGFYYQALTNVPVGNLPGNPSFWINLGAVGGIAGTRPNYFQLSYENIQYVFILPTNYSPPEIAAPPSWNAWNRTFNGYQDLVDTLNACAANIVIWDPVTSPYPGTASIANDVSFQYNATLNRIVFVPKDTANYYYIPCGYADKQIDAFIANKLQSVNPEVALWLPRAYKSGYILNTRLGFTWNGLTNIRNFFNPVLIARNLYPYMRPADPFLIAGGGVGNPNLEWNTNVVTAQSYPDLVYTSVCRIYTDITLGSTQDSVGEGNLLSVVPMNANNLGIAFYQSAFNNPLTKIPETITEFNIRLITDAGDPLYLPNSAVVNLELAITYK